MVKKFPNTILWVLLLSFTVAILFWFAPKFFQYPVQISMVLKSTLRIIR